MIRLIPDDIIIFRNKLKKPKGKFIISKIKNELMPEIKPIKIILKLLDNTLDKFKLSKVLSNFNNKNMQAKTLTNVVENTNPLTPKFRGDSSPQGLEPPMRNQSKNRFSKIAIIDILNGVLASSIP